MKVLKINPQSHEIEMVAEDLDSSSAKVLYTIGEITDSIYLRASEAERIGKWMLKLAEEIREAK